MWYFFPECVQSSWAQSMTVTHDFCLALYRMTHAMRDNEMTTLPAVPMYKCCGNLGRHRPDAKGDKTTSSSGDSVGVGNYSSRLWEAGLKLVADGSPHCGTAATQEPYLQGPLTNTLGFPPAPGYGTLNMETDALCDTVKRCHLQGKQLAIHCHGERSCEQVLRSYEQVCNIWTGRWSSQRMFQKGYFWHWCLFTIEGESGLW